MALFLGIDPGLSNTGWGAVSSDATCDSFQFLDCGIVKTSVNEPLEVRLLFIFDSMTHLLQKLKPDRIALEKVFVNKNPVSSEKLIMARTAVYMAIAKSMLPLFEFSPNEIKKNITGNGHADKNMVNNMVQKILRIHIDSSNLPKSQDYADALAIALCAAFHKGGSGIA